ncbi:MAG: NUDIX hydrolase [Thioploca sp.]|nr:NUDIX hydrolase [Thioploca sp.]
MIEQFRPAAIGHADGAWLWEIVAGIRETSETLEAVVYREAEEEMGCPVTNIIPIGQFFVSHSSTTERNHHIFLWTSQFNASQRHSRCCCRT